jgi:polyhydroxybutyrate depolymerase
VAAAVVAIALVAASCGGRGEEGASSPAPVETTPTSCGDALGSEGGELTITVDGAERDALVHMPVSAEGEAQPLPVVIGLHGYNGNPSFLAEYTGLTQKADESGFIAVLPAGYGVPSEWHFAGYPSISPADTEHDVAFLDALVDRLVRSPCVDAERIYVIGHSMGGGMAEFYGCLRAARLAGIALVAAEHFELPCQPSRPIAVIAFHAVDDPILPYEGGEVAGTRSGFPEVLPVEDVAAAWAARDGCTGGPSSESLDGGTVRSTWQGCAAPVVHYRLPLGGHRWPGGSEEGPDAGISATDVLWEFFSTLP